MNLKVNLLSRLQKVLFLTISIPFFFCRHRCFPSIWTLKRWYFNSDFDPDPKIFKNFDLKFRPPILTLFLSSCCIRITIRIKGKSFFTLFSLSTTSLWTCYPFSTQIIIKNWWLFVNHTPTLQNLFFCPFSFYPDGTLEHTMHLKRTNGRPPYLRAAFE